MRTIPAGSMRVKDYLKSRNSRIILDLEFNEDVLFNNFTRMSRTNFHTLLGIVEPMIAKQNTTATGSVTVFDTVHAI
jgi:hypothetical protein